MALRNILTDENPRLRKISKKVEEITPKLLTLLDDMADTMNYECPYNSDLETGEAFCYMFEPVDTPSFSDEWFDENKAENELNRKRTEIKDKISK